MRPARNRRLSVLRFAIVIQQWARPGASPQHGAMQAHSHRYLFFGSVRRPIHHAFGADNVAPSNGVARLRHLVCARPPRARWASEKMTRSSLRRARNSTQLSPKA